MKVAPNNSGLFAARAEARPKQTSIKRVDESNYPKKKQAPPCRNDCAFSSRPSYYSIEAILSIIIDRVSIVHRIPNGSSEGSE